MKCSAKKLAVIFALIFLLIPAMEAGEKDKRDKNVLPPLSDPMSVGQARRAVVAGLMSANRYFVAVKPGSVRFTQDSLEFDGQLQLRPSDHFKIDLKTLEPIFIKPYRDSYWDVCNEAGKQIASPLRDIGFWDVNHNTQKVREGVTFTREAEAVARSFAAGLNRLRAIAVLPVDVGNFHAQAASWRALAAKPPIPEEARTQRLLAENAVREKKPEEALTHYETGLELYPTWPQGYFNAALIAAELGFYAEAVENMQSYLELLPDAPDAQSARDQIVIWRYKAKEMK